MTTLSRMITMLAGHCGATKLLRDIADPNRALKRLLDPYQPELHYMRGPGPKWHAKHDPAPAVVETSGESVTCEFSNA